MGLKLHTFETSQVNKMCNQLIVVVAAVPRRTIPIEN